ncbi:MAG: 3-dehydroquinate synthase [Dissulfurimicrobium hydrothermale]|uniref:3-dehydroquinate synthase n=1 Tax=Dissulfurimicrobium hydrothermale TaxID=1750598 RepID=UPI003C77355A
MMGEPDETGARSDFNFIRYKVNVPLGERAYKILIGPGLLSDAAGLLKPYVQSGRCIIVTDTNVEGYIGRDLTHLLRQAGLDAELISFEAGEASKRMDTVVELARKMVALKADRDTVLIALGGGVVGDVAGFLASIYMRGIAFVQAPTTLLAQVDSSVGGKTGVDLPEGKNLLGTFYQPRLVIADIATLATLNQQEIRNGLAEVVKYAMIKDPALFDLLEARPSDALNLEPELISHIVRTSCRIKAKVVCADEREGGLRRILNFGHTAGHAIEAASKYEMPHGEAVAIGMIVAMRLSVAKGLTNDAVLKRLERLLRSLGLPTRIPSQFQIDEIITLTASDKKSRGGRIHFVLSGGPGRAVITDDVSREEFFNAIEASKGPETLKEAASLPPSSSR